MGFIFKQVPHKFFWNESNLINKLEKEMQPT